MLPSKTKDGVGTDSEFYTDALAYWSSVPPTVDGMLGGYGYISKTDVKGSTQFLRELINNKKLGISRVLDCGAGIGRVTKNLLLPIFDTVDLLEYNKKFLDEAPNYIGSEKSRVGEYYCSGMQNFTPTHMYDVIWCQWVVGHLTNEHLIDFFKRCRRFLLPNGVIVVKDNATGRSTVYDDEDSSFTRTLSELKSCISRADLTIVKEELQQGFPPTIYTVPMIAFR